MNDPTASSHGLDQHGLDRDYPLLYEMAMQYDFAERLGGSGSALHDEADAALRELWFARREKAANSEGGDR